MATWDNVVYTTLGLNLMAKLQTGATLEITRAVGGDGHTSADALTALTEVTARQTLTLSNVVYKGSGQALLPVTLYNRGLTAGYPLRQIGIYAADPDDGEVLMLVAQSEQPDTIPSAEDSPDFVANFSFHIALGNAGRINVSYSLTDMATKADYVAYVEQIEGRLGQPSGIATLDSSGKLAQMPTAADVGAIKLCWSDLINETTATPNKYNFDDYITPGDVVSVDNYAGAQSIANIPEAVPGKLYVLPLRTDDQERNDLMQEYHTVTGNVWCRPRYYYSGNTWSAWGTSANCTRMDSGVYIDLPGGMHICVGSQTYTKVEINNQTNAGCYVSGRLYFNGFPKQYRYAPRCLISLSVGSNGPYWLSVDSNGPSTTRPQGVLLASTIGTTVATVTLSYFAIGIS